MRTAQKHFLPVTALLLFSSIGFAQPDTLNLQERNKQLVLLINDLFNRNMPEQAMRYFSDSLVKMGDINGKSFFRAINDDIQQTFPDVQTRITRLWADGDWVIADCIFSGTHRGIATLPHHGGLLIGKEPTNKPFKVQHIRMYRISKGRIVERRAVRDDVGMYQQLGLLPQPAPIVKPN
jgi:predicted ester cyclase